MIRLENLPHTSYNINRKAANYGRKKTFKRKIRRNI